MGHQRAVAATLVRLTSSVTRASEGLPLVFTARVRTVDGSAPVATGLVSFWLDSRLLGAAALDESGVAAYSVARLEAGVHAVTAAYGGDARHAAATSTPLPQAVTAAAVPVVLLVAAPAVVPAGVQLEAELVDPHTGRLAEDAEGQLVFSSASAAIAVADLVAGHARVVVPELPPGPVRAFFPGDGEHAAAVGVFDLAADR